MSAGFAHKLLLLFLPPSTLTLTMSVLKRIGRILRSKNVYDDESDPLGQSEFLS